MLSIVYVSSATRLFAAEDLVALLQAARDYNARIGITGMLLYKAGNFLQVIEGDAAAVNALYEKRRSC